MAEFSAQTKASIKHQPAFACGQTAATKAGLLGVPFSRQPLQNRMPRVQVLPPLPKRSSHRFGDCFFFVIWTVWAFFAAATVRVISCNNIWFTGLRPGVFSMRICAGKYANTISWNASNRIENLTAARYRKFKTNGEWYRIKKTAILRNSRVAVFFAVKFGFCTLNR